MTRPVEAMERLRRVKAGEESWVAIYREAFPDSHGWSIPPHAYLDGKHVEEQLIPDDNETLADYLLSRIHGERPEAIARTQECIFDDEANEFAEVESAWAITETGEVIELECHCVDCQPADWPAYRTEYAATLALLYQHWDALDALVERLGVINKESEVVG